MNFRDAMEYQAQFAETSSAPITARVCRALADAIDDSTETGRRVIGWSGHYIADAVPLRLVAPFHFLFREGRCPALGPLFGGDEAESLATSSLVSSEVETRPVVVDPVARLSTSLETRGDSGRPTDIAVIRTALADHDAEINQWLDGPPQTNEAARSATFMATLLVLADRFGHAFELLEIGSSAGLNLMIDHYRYDLGGVRVGPSASTVIIKPEWKGPPPPDAPVKVRSIRGVDIAPIDVRDQDAAARLLAYVWVDQTERFARTEAAIALIRTDYPALEKGDAADFVERQLAEPQADKTTRVLMHSIVWQYLPAETQQRITTAMETAGEAATIERPLAWIAFEADRELRQHIVRLRIWPGDVDTVVALAHPHASWIAWSRLDDAV